MGKLSANAKGAVFISIVAVIYLVDGMSLNVGTVGMPGEGFVPRVMGIFLLFCCVLLILKEVAFRRVAQEQSESEEAAGDGGNGKRPMYLMLALLLYTALLPILGFIISTLGLMLVSLKIFEFKNWLWACLIAIAATATTYLIFQKWLQILFPPGLWG